MSDSDKPIDVIVVGAGLAGKLLLDLFTLNYVVA